ncbi:hypothetical protein VspSTUT11_14270 [Vibrio sp. STUT-A11]|nr:hypothetical protein VspSTUT11_14270 [Vibrio sp. STUT-A11]
MNITVIIQKIYEKRRAEWEARMLLPFSKRVVRYSLPFTVVFCLGSNVLFYEGSWDISRVINLTLLIIIGSIVVELIMSKKSKY